jgi:lipopolysaccharide assembly protein B
MAAHRYAPRRGPAIVCGVFELPPLLLALAFILVGVAAWFLGRRNGAARTVRLPRDYYVGLDHLINDRFEHATEIFARMAEADGDAAEIQFALGSLFRRRGEVERAIAIHSRLRDQGGAPLRDKAAFALALDYLSAGLQDRAERVLEELAASREYRNAALDHLVRIYESQGDWARALKIFHELPAAVQAERRRVAAHYLCELAEQALLQGDAERARTLLRQARTHHAQLPRADILTARIAEGAGDADGALLLYLEALESSPGLALEIIPPVLRIAAARGGADVLAELGTRLRRSGRVSPRQLAWLLATAVPAPQMTAIPGIAASLGAGIESSADAASLSALLTRIGDAGGRYQCEECGLNSVGWYWHCPKCRAWDSLRPAVFKWAERVDRGAPAPAPAARSSR